MRTTFREALNKGITPSQRRNLVLKQVTAEVIAGKPSYHTGAGTTVCTILHALEEAGEGYVLFARPGQGYQIEAAKQATEQEWKDKLTPPVPDALLGNFQRVLDTVKESERTNTRSAGVDYACRDFIREHGDALMTLLDNNQKTT